ncbi:phosphatidylglycerophosphatase and protein-tyrosine phosphatase 1-like [Corticium candelabrum]|uniref:phosphatidylglycerophosphatase and protein-tyrosine phosphatase 1-like n=1 Tax=Corticium candelabrum TaxID=121492 RepID=UPI002E260DEC|nr:phosphatidylglycerophosphatase and protein-tyrosine phosphatase 1-like [Corticium candelabrum]
MFLYWLLPRLLYFPSLLWNIVRQGGNRRWYDRIDNFVLLGALPLRRHADELVEKHSIKGVISINESYETRFFTFSPEEWASRGIEYIRLDVREYFYAPSLLQISTALNMIERLKKMDHNVYVHCKAGRGRSATLVACYLMKDQKLNPQEAVDLLKAKRPQVKLGKFQWEAIREFYRQENEHGKWE